MTVGGSVSRTSSARRQPTYYDTFCENLDEFQFAADIIMAPKYL